MKRCQYNYAIVEVSKDYTKPKLIKQNITDKKIAFEEAQTLSWENHKIYRVVNGDVFCPKVVEAFNFFHADGYIKIPQSMFITY